MKNIIVFLVALCTIPLCQSLVAKKIKLFESLDKVLLIKEKYPWFTNEVEQTTYKSMNIVANKRTEAFDNLIEDFKAFIQEHNNFEQEKSFLDPFLDFGKQEVNNTGELVEIYSILVALKKNN